MNIFNQNTTLKCSIQRQQRWFESSIGLELLSAVKQTVEPLISKSIHHNSSKDAREQQSIQVANSMGALIDFGDQTNLIKIVSEPVKPFDAAVIVAEGTELPLVPDNASLMVLHHLCDFSEHPQQVIREAILSLAPEGKLVVIGFNPVSLWGLWGLAARWFKPMPWRANFISPQRMTDWLTLLNCQIEQKRFIIYKPAVKRRNFTSRFRFIGTLAERYNLPFGAVYVITATKKTRGRTPIRNRWKRPELKPLMTPKPSYRHFDSESKKTSEHKP